MHFKISELYLIMTSKQFYLIIIIIIFVLEINCIDILLARANSSMQITCPNTFTYDTYNKCSDVERQFPCEWCGTIQVILEKVTTITYLEVNLDKDGKVVKKTPTAGLISTSRKKTVIEFREPLNINPGIPSKFNICVKYLEETNTPIIKKILVDGKIICNVKSNKVRPEPVLGGSTPKNNTRFWTIPPSVNPMKHLLSPSNYQCGIQPTKPPKPLILNGLDTDVGQYPWHAAIYAADSDDCAKYRCGGTLVSKNHVVTAAHCVVDIENDNRKKSLSVYFGKLYLSRWDTVGLQVIPVEKIQMHEDFNRNNLDNDIAVLTLHGAAEYTDYVRPICVNPQSNELDNIVNRTGIVVGWGLNNDFKASDRLEMTKLPVISKKDCKNSNKPFFSQYLSDKKYCAGVTNGNVTAVCNGDSGGGMIFPIKPNLKHETNLKIWYLRGIVSFSVPLNGRSICDSSHYSVFTDVSKYYNWLKNITN